MAEPMTPHLDEARRLGGVKALLAERDQLRADLARARQRIDAALAEHQPRQVHAIRKWCSKHWKIVQPDHGHFGWGEKWTIATECPDCDAGIEDQCCRCKPSESWPCATVRALTGDGQAAP